MKSQLADLVRERREELKMSIVDAAERARVARSTWYRVEGAAQERLSTQTANGIDDALGWERGTSAGIFADQGTGATIHFIDGSVRIIEPRERGDTREELEDTLDRLDNGDLIMLLRIARRLDETARTVVQLRERVLEIIDRTQVPA